MSLLTGEGNESTCRRLCNSKQTGYEGSLEEEGNEQDPAIALKKVKLILI